MTCILAVIVLIYSTVQKITESCFRMINGNYSLFPYFSVHLSLQGFNFVSLSVLLLHLTKNLDWNLTWRLKTRLGNWKEEEQDQFRPLSRLSWTVLVNWPTQEIISCQFVIKLNDAFQSSIYWSLYSVYLHVEGLPEAFHMFDGSMYA